MTCREAVVELVECARRVDGVHASPGRELRTHLAICGACSERWEAERQLTAHLGIMRRHASTLGSPASRGNVLRREFARTHQSINARTSHLRYARWAVAAAAAVLLVVFLGHGTRNSRTKPAVSAASVSAASVSNASFSAASFSSDASALSSDDFMAIPYTPPLAPGEMVRIVRADMYPETLASMGVEVDLLAWAGRAGDVPVEMVVGEDGMPRAVRITESNQF